MGKGPPIQGNIRISDLWLWMAGLNPAMESRCYCRTFRNSLGLSARVVKRASATEPLK